MEEEEEEEGLEGEVGGASLGVLEELLDEVQLDQKTALEFVELVSQEWSWGQRKEWLQSERVVL